MSVRLSDNVLPSQYEIELRVTDLVKCTFSGKVAITVNVKNATNTVTLHALDLKITDAIVTFGGPDSTRLATASAHTLNEKLQTMTVEFADPIPAGEAVLKFSFEGVLNDKLCGFYRSAYTAPSGEKRYMAVTQFEPCDARRAFPCFDEPAMKAVFSITLVVPADRTAVSNMPIASEESDGTVRRVCFAPSPVMSTYLVAFVVGEMEHIEQMSADNVLVRVFTQKGRKAQGEFALRVGAQAVTFFHDFFGLPYPIPKMDMLAIPDFAAGAMENYGCITYRETRLLIDPRGTSTATKQAASRTICHEISHQWFGNLVTMQWWTHLWLNEGFARWAEHMAVDHIFPEWDIWTQFVGQVQSSALSLDSLRSTHAIEVDVNDPAEINEIFDTISYAKGASVIRMLEAFIGADAFKRGLGAYLARYQFANAATEDLWASLGEASGQPVGELMRSWTRQPGYPVLTVREERVGDKRRLHLEQRRFFKDGLDVADTTLWQVPVTLTWQGARERTTFIMRERTATVDVDAAPGAWLKINLEQTGLYRVNYTTEQWHALAAAVARQELPPRDRMGLQNDAFALAGAGLLPTSMVLSMLSAFSAERDFSVLDSLAGNLALLRAVFDEEPFIDLLRALTARVFRPILAEVGVVPRDGDAHLTTMTRSLAVEVMVAGCDEAVTRELVERARRFLDGQTDALPADIRGAALRAAAKADPAVSALLWRVYLQAELQEDRARALSAMGGTTDESALQAALERFSEVKTQDAPTLFAGVAAHRAGREAAWRFLRDRFEEVYGRIGSGQFLMPGIISSVIARFTTEAAAQEIAAFFDSHPVPGAERTVQQALESVRFKARWRTRDAAAVAQWLAAQQL